MAPCLLRPADPAYQDSRRRAGNRITSRMLGAVGQQHHQAVDADAAAAGGRHAVFERAHEVVVVVHGFVVAAVLGVDLRVEARGLVFGVVELGEAIAEFAAGDVELEALGHFGALVVGARQRRDLGRVLHDEGRLPELFFHRFLEVHHLQAGQRAALRELVLFLGQAELAQRVDQPGGVVHVGAGFGVLEDGFADGQPLEGLAPGRPACPVAQLQRAARPSAATSRIRASVKSIRSR